MALGGHRSSEAEGGDGRVSSAPFRTAALQSRCLRSWLHGPWLPLPWAQLDTCLGASGSPASGHWVRLQAGGVGEGLEPSWWRVTRVLGLAGRGPALPFTPSSGWWDKGGRRWAEWSSEPL